MTRGVFLRGSVWWINYRDKDGKRHFESIGRNKRLAERVYAQRIAEIESGKFGVRLKSPTFGEFVETWRKETHLERSTWRAYEWMLRIHIIPEFGNSTLLSIDRARIRGFLASLAQRSRQPREAVQGKGNRPVRVLSRKTVRNIVALLSSVLECAASDHDLIETNPTRGLLKRSRMPRELAAKDPRPKALQLEDFKNAVHNVQDFRIRKMVLFAGLTGLRWGELCAIRRDDADLRRGLLHVTRSFDNRQEKNPKTLESMRSVDLSPLVKDIIRACPRSEGLIFSRDGVTPMSDGSWPKRVWVRAQKAAGIREPLPWKNLRHQFASLQIAAGKTLPYVASQMGHRDPTTTLRNYSHWLRTTKPVYVEFAEDLMWPPDCHQIVTDPAFTPSTTERNQ